MRVRNSTIILGLVVILMLIWYALSNKIVKTSLPLQSFDSSEVDMINSKIQKLEDEMDGNLKAMSSIKEKLNLLLDLQPTDEQTDNRLENIIHPNFIEDAVGDSYTCPVTVPLGKSNSQHTMNEFYEKWDFVDVDGGVWKQGWPITTSDEEWHSTRLKVFVMPHSHNDPGWIKTLDTYYVGQTRKILNVVVDNLSGHPNRKFVWAETIFLDLWFNDPEVTLDRKNKFRQLLAAKQIEILTGGWVMTEEAPSHYFAMIDQLIEGHQWLKTNLNYRPSNGYNCDTFGASPTTAYLNKLSNIKHMLIQRTHYHVKKHFAEDHLLEFNWRQTFDNVGTDDILTHMMPFYSYDVPHTCGPDPSICCQFDFRRLRGQSPPIQCPWRIAPTEITNRNIDERARTLLDQYRKKAKLFRRGDQKNIQVVLIPLGDDFRMDSDTEAVAQFSNYEKLFEYINSQASFNTEISFGTLGDYFDAVVDATPVNNFPSISGDFFSYADRTDNYWTGFFNSRPYYKWFDRYLEHWVQATDTVFSIGLLQKRFFGTEKEAFYNDIQGASRTLDLFQHHDAITGTEKDFVVRDYAERLAKSLHHLKESFVNIIEKMLGVHITLPISNPGARGVFPTYNILSILPNMCQRVAVLNSLFHAHDEIIKLRVSGSDFYRVQYTDDLFTPQSQITPFWLVQGSGGELSNVIDESSFELVIGVTVPGLSTRNIDICGALTSSDATSPLSTIELYNSASAQGLTKFNSRTMTDAKAVILSNSMTAATLNGKNGLAKSIKTSELGHWNHILLEFVSYGTRKSGDKSGAYLFMPDGPAKSYFGQEKVAPFRVIRGPLINQVHVLHDKIKHVLTLNSFGSARSAVDIQNYFDIRGSNNFELVMRFNTEINSEGIFYSDLNGLTHSKRVHYEKLPLQANVYPIVSSAYLQDAEKRFNILTKQSSGVSSLKDGQLDIWLDRYISQDDNRGLNQPLIDNVPTMHEYKIVLEKKTTVTNNQNIYQSLYCNRMSEYFHSPFISMAMSSPTMKKIEILSKEVPFDAKLINLRPICKEDTNIQTALILRRYGNDCMFNDLHNMHNNVQWPIKVKELFGDFEMDETLLNGIEVLETNVEEITIEPMKIKTYLIK